MQDFKVAVATCLKEHIEELVQEYNRLIEGVKGFFEERKREEQE